jgi:hypothetical protein
VRILFDQDGTELLQIALGDSAQTVNNLTLTISPELAAALDNTAQNAPLGGRLNVQSAGVVAASLTLSVGFITWMLKAGSLLASFLATRPAWTNFDPLPIFAKKDDDEDERDAKAERRGSANPKV